MATMEATTAAPATTEEKAEESDQQWRIIRILQQCLWQTQWKIIRILQQCLWQTESKRILQQGKRKHDGKSKDSYHYNIRPSGRSYGSYNNAYGRPSPSGYYNNGRGKAKEITEAHSYHYNIRTMQQGKRKRKVDNTVLPMGKNGSHFYKLLVERTDLQYKPTKSNHIITYEWTTTFHYKSYDQKIHKLLLQSTKNLQIYGIRHVTMIRTTNFSIADVSIAAILGLDTITKTNLKLEIQVCCGYLSSDRVNVKLH
eukprot:172651-Amphidinium_carterae.2